MKYIEGVKKHPGLIATTIFSTVITFLGFSILINILTEATRQIFLLNGSPIFYLIIFCLYLLALIGMINPLHKLYWICAEKIYKFLKRGEKE